MHSTLRVELRGTQRILDIARSRTLKKPARIIRPFSQGYPCRDTGKPDKGTPARSAVPSTSSSRAEDFGRTSTTNLGSDIERWINHLSDHGRSLQVWDTISERDQNGKWTLLPQARRDLEDVSQWAKDRSSSTDLSFGIKVEKGRIRAVSTQDLRRDKESDISTGLVHGPFITEIDTRDAHETNSTQKEPAADLKTITKFGARTGTGNENEISNHIPEPSTTSSLEAPKFHGSAAARRQRAQRSRDVKAAYVLPEWFSSQNISLQSQTDSSAHSRIQTSLGTSFVDSRDGIVLWHADDAKLLPSSVVEESLDETQKAASADGQEPILSSGGAPEPQSDASSQPDTSSGSSRSPPIFIPLPNANKTYYVEEAQHNELLASAKGRLQPPASGSLDNRPGGIKGHLNIHFAAADGELFLDHLVGDMAKRLGCNLIKLDAQDISSLIVEADVDSLIKHEASTLGYDIYGDIYKNDATDQDDAQSAPSEDPEDVEEDFGAPAARGMPFMVGKPITIDLKALFSSKPHRRSTGFRPSNIMPDVFTGPNTSKSNPPIFAAIVDSIFSSASTLGKGESPGLTQDGEQRQGDPDKTIESRRNPTIVHVRDFRSIQDTNIGKQFLMQLYDQVERRRATGESIMLVGTECSRDNQASYDKARIDSLQSSDQEEISSTLVITPAGADGDSDLAADRLRRLQIINTRHLWQMLQSKNISLRSLQPSFWKGEISDEMHAADKSYLEKGLWSLGYVQRLASILASSDFSNSQHPVAEAAAMIELSDNSKFTWAKQGRKDILGDTKRSGSEHADRLAKIREKANKHEKRLMSGVVEPKKIATTFNDIHIPEDTVESLQTLTTLSLQRPDAFKYGVLASDRIPGLLLYGPPGTGKTLAAKAVARESGATMLEVSSADINDMYVGEGEKNVKALFSLARKLSPCVVFLDEADAMFSARSAQGRRVSHRELLNQFLKEWDGMSNDSGSAFIMVATNRPMDLDDAVLRRLPRRILIDLPTEKDRLEILKIHLRHEQLAEDVNLSQLATKTPFYSGSDLKNLAVSAALNAVREETARAKNKQGDTTIGYPDKRILTGHDFEKALDEIGASISEDMSSLRDIKKFDEQYGDRKGRKRKAPKWGFNTAAEADAVLDTVKVRS